MSIVPLGKNNPYGKELEVIYFLQDKSLVTLRDPSDLREWIMGSHKSVSINLFFGFGEVRDLKRCVLFIGDKDSNRKPLDPLLNTLGVEYQKMNPHGMGILTLSHGENGSPHAHFNVTTHCSTFMGGLCISETEKALKEELGMQVKITNSGRPPAWIDQLFGPNDD
ncbi:MAG: hypothetical protein Q7R79_05345 [bacterium]|nr:hypothetical protein [bacterium]